ncbi:hypothetical protein HanHA300_Chr13g0502321 [Helianthus annuus]|nr:hypothetical protein HanHA300_Chr13g0502321 [Helianthus annuus]KAJ0499526.1 hypothetical protein HanHA89_Chr13g0535041 [Helianthus annuus]KAJ0672990.1 hypothetical protein HanOQP8_Chr13g0503271 [Helianthus annuus]
MSDQPSDNNETPVETPVVFQVALMSFTISVVVLTSSLRIQVLNSCIVGGFNARPKLPTERSILVNEGLVAALNEIPFS